MLHDLKVEWTTGLKPQRARSMFQHKLQCCWLQNLNPKLHLQMLTYFVCNLHSAMKILLFIISLKVPHVTFYPRPRMQGKEKEARPPLTETFKAQVVCHKM